MSNLNLPEPKSSQQARAFDLLILIGDGTKSLAELVEISGNEQDTRRSIRFLRGNSYIHILRYNGPDPIYKGGPGKDAKRTQAPAHREETTNPEVKIPAPDPLLAALFARRPPE